MSEPISADPWLVFDWSIAARLAGMPSGAKFKAEDRLRCTSTNGVIDHIEANDDQATIYFSWREDKDGAAVVCWTTNPPTLSIDLRRFQAQQLRATAGYLTIFENLDKQNPTFTFSRGYGYSGPSD